MIALFRIGRASLERTKTNERETFLRARVARTHRKDHERFEHLGDVVITRATRTVARRLLALVLRVDGGALMNENLNKNAKMRA